MPPRAHAVPSLPPPTSRYDDDAISAHGSDHSSVLSGLSSYDGDVLGATTPASKLAAAAAAGAASGAAAVASLPAVEEEEDGTYVGLGIQLQEPTDGGGASAGFVVTKLIRGAPGDKCVSLHSPLPPFTPLPIMHTSP